MTFAELAELDELDAGVFAGGWDDSWRQGPGIFGGLVAAGIARCVQRTVPGRTLRCLSVQLCAPLRAAAFTVEVVEERRGSYVSYVSVRVMQEGAPAVLAQATLGRDRPVEGDFLESAIPPLLPAEKIPDLGWPPGIPAFVQHWQMRFDHGIPGSAQAVARTGGHLRPVRPEPLSLPLLMGLLDTWPLAILPTFNRMRPAASVAIQFVLFEPPPLPEETWYTISLTSERQAGGFSEQRGRLWAPDGTLLGVSNQLVLRLG